MTDFPGDIQVAIVAHDNLGSLPATLQSLAAARCPLDRVTVVDVASTDGTRDWLAHECPAVHVLGLDRNDGPNPGRNAGITGATSRFVLLMDADVRVQPDTVQLLHRAMVADRTIKVGSPIVVHADRPDLIQYAGGAMHWICEAVNPWLNRPLAERGREPVDIGAVSASALLLDRDAALEVGLFDERYFMGKDDGDFAHRIRMAGHAIREVPASLVFHKSRPRSSWLFYYQIRNRWHFILKNYQLKTIVCLVPILLVHEPLQLIVLLAKGHGAAYLRAVGGLLAMLPDLPRDRALANRIRVKPDRDLLVSGPMVIREDLAANILVRHGKALYEGLLTAYWNLLKRTVLASSTVTASAGTQSRW
jgi:GT2 family glycosyltransferase